MSEGSESTRLPASALALIAVNALPLLGVLFAGWDVLTIVLLYWFETAIIGAINILRMLAAQGDIGDMVERLQRKRGRGGVAAHKELKTQMGRMVGGANSMAIAKFFMVPFFCVHFGMFMMVHLVFIFVFLGGGMSRGGGSPFSAIGDLPAVLTPLLVVSMIALFASHLFSFFRNYIGGGEFRTTTAPEQMMRPYGRVVVMHLAIIFGGFATIALGQRMGLLLVLVAGKTIIDLTLHLREHRKAMGRGAGLGGGGFDGGASGA